MTRYPTGCVIACSLAIVSLPALTQDGVKPNDRDSKHIFTTLRNGRGQLTFEADNVDKEWVSSVIHLQGKVLVKISIGPKDSRTVTFLHADRVDYFEKTGEFTPSGNVRLSIEDPR